MFHRLDRHPWAWLGLGAIVLIMSQMRFGLGVFAWVAPVPWLHYLRLTRGTRSTAALGGVGLLAWSLATAKIVTDPVPLVMALGFGLAFTIALGVPYLAWSWIRRRVSEDAASLAFPVFMVLGEWSLHGLLPFGVWGSAADTQLDQLALLQLASVTGVHGVSFLVYAVAAILERGLSGERSSLRLGAGLVATSLVATVAFGQARLALSSSAATPTRLVAAVGTDSMVGATPGLPDRDRLAEVERGLVARTERAAAAGATLVVWNEAAAMVYPSDEPAWLERLGTLAQRLRIDLVAAYVVPLQTEPLLYENKYVFFRPDGSIDHRYLKHEPVPGEPAVKGEGPMPLVEDAGQGSVGGAICFDYDFPRLALANAQHHADLVALPSSDWRGIDPIHTHMAAVRAIESGHSILRSTRFGLSAGIDPWGRIRGWSSHWDDDDHVLLVRLPRHGVQTVYGRAGDWFPLTCLLGGLALVGLAIRRRS
ncbi:MAG: hypothetical protein JKY37_00445 [Nannocystaceae bacterium]|nr:hypothetical protein [Nannocystaceae bacterium]